MEGPVARSGGPADSLVRDLLPFAPGELETLVRQVPGSPSGPVRLTGFTLMVAMVRWLAEIAMPGLSSAALRALEAIQIRVLVHLQREDDDLDGQSQVGGGGKAARGLAVEGLARFFPADASFWRHFRRLSTEQDGSARWELGHKGTAPAFDDALFHALARKGALLRWPAWALAELAGRPDRAPDLDDVFERFIGVAVLFDDLGDFEQDRERGQVNSVACAGGAQSSDPLQFFPRAALGAAVVCRKSQDELLRIAAEFPGTGLARFCEYRASRCRPIAEAIAERCRIRSLMYVLGQLVPPDA